MHACASNGGLTGRCCSKNQNTMNEHSCLLVHRRKRQRTPEAKLKSDREAKVFTLLETESALAPTRLQSRIPLRTTQLHKRWAQHSQILAVGLAPSACRATTCFSMRKWCPNLLASTVLSGDQVGNSALAEPGCSSWASGIQFAARVSRARACTHPVRKGASLDCFDICQCAPASPAGQARTN